MINPKDIFSIEKYLDDNVRSKEDKRLSNNERQDLLVNIIEPIRSLISYGNDKNYSKYVEIYYNVETGVNGIKSLINNNPQIIRDALHLYKTDQEEIIYLTLLDKKISDMTGYEAQILYSFFQKNK